MSPSPGRRVVTSVTLVLLVAGAACDGGGGRASSAAVTVVAAFYPLQFAVQRVGAGAVAVESLTPSGVEPHDLELSSSQITDLATADLVVYLGEGFQPSVEDAVAGLDDSQRLDALEGVDTLSGSATGGDATIDPHVWLDPIRMSEIVAAIAGRLEQADPDDKTHFADNARDVERELHELDADYRAGLEDCESRAIVTSHAAFGYLADRYDLQQVSVAGIDPEAEPSPRRLADVVAYVKQHHVHTVFFEELAPPDIAETLARETGAQTEVLSPLETTPERGNYFDVMRSNLGRLREALDCE